MDKEAIVSGADAAAIISRFNPYRNWAWFLTLNRLGKTAGCAPVPFLFDGDGVSYRLGDIVAFIKDHVSPLDDELRICDAIDRLGGKEEQELERLLYLMAGSHESASPSASGQQPSPDADKLGDGALVNEELMEDFLEALNTIRQTQEECAQNFVALAYAFEAIADAEGEKYPDISSMVSFSRTAIKHAQRNTDNIDQLTDAVGRMLERAISPEMFQLKKLAVEQKVAA